MRPPARSVRRPRSSFRLLRWVLVTGAGVALAACVAGPDLADVDARVDRLVAARHQRLAAARADFAGRRPFPRTERSAVGTVVLERAELVGGMDREFLRLRVTYVNDTLETFDRVRLAFTVQDVLGRVLSRHDVDFVMPLDYRFVPRTTYTSEVQVPAGDAFEARGWDLSVAVTAETW